MPRTLLPLMTLLLLCRVGYAAPEVAPDSAVHTSKARQLFDEQKYSEAADELREAYKISPNPIFLFNAGQSYRKADEKAKALQMYQLFLKNAPDSKLAPEAKGYVAELESAIALQTRLSNIKLELEAERAESDAAQLQAKEARLRAEQAQKALERERKKPWYRRGWFYGIVGSVVGVLAIGAVSGGLAVANDPRRKVDSRDLQVSF
jgi:tetratricopeptide (TPR) repeat protein